MAWSEAARKAAAETRRLHKAAKRSIANGTNPYIGRGRSVSRASTRLALANHLRAMRKNLPTPGVTRQSATRFAAVSTAFRNAARHK